MGSITARRIAAAAACVMAVGAAAPAAAKAASPSAGGGSSAAVHGRKAPPPVTRNGPVEMYAVNGSETLNLRLRDDRGRPLKGVQKRFDHFLRCHHTNVQHAMNPRLVRLLYQVGRHYPGRRMEVVSGYRHPTVAKNPRSPHMQGLACDFRIAGVRNQDLRDYLRRNYEKVGVGYYPNSAFVHLDVRKDRSAFWIDYSGPGERAVYADDPVADLKTGRADTYKPTTIDKNWASDADQEGDTDRALEPGRPSPMEEGEGETGGEAPSAAGPSGSAAPAPVPAPPSAPAADATAASGAPAAAQPTSSARARVNVLAGGPVEGSRSSTLSQ